MISICKPSCGRCSVNHECTKFRSEPFQQLTIPHLHTVLNSVLVRLRVKLDAEHCAAQGWQHLALESGPYDA